MISEDLHDEAFLREYCVGFERVRAYVMGETDGVAKTPEWASEITEVDAGTISGLARRMASVRSLMNVTWSVQRADHGEQPFWAAVALSSMLGQVGLPGGGFGFGYGSSGGSGIPVLAWRRRRCPRGPVTWRTSFRCRGSARCC